jgi:hypothetical protein
MPATSFTRRALLGVLAACHASAGRWRSRTGRSGRFELTLPGFEGYDWNGIFVPHGTPGAIVQKLNAATNAALVSPQVSARFAELNVESRQNSPDEFRAYVEDQMALWSRVGGQRSQYQARLARQLK